KKGGDRVPGGHGVVVRAAAEEIDQRRARVDQRCDRLLVCLRGGRCDALPVGAAQPGDLVGKATAVQFLEVDGGLKRREHLADLLDVEAGVGLDRETGALDGGEDSASTEHLALARQCYGC